MKPQAVLTEEGITDRFESYMDYHFPAVDRPQEEWIEMANENKKPMAAMLGLPHPNAGLVISVAPQTLDYNLQTSLTAMIRRAEKSMEISRADYGWDKMEVDIDSLTYLNQKGKRQKLLRQLRKLDLDEQKKAFNSLTGILGLSYSHFDPQPDGNMPFEKMWPKLGDKLKAKLVVLLTPDPIMVLGSGLFKNTGSCHRPGGEYHQGPFTYAQDCHTMVALVFDESDYKNLTPSALFTPYRSAQWTSQGSICGRALGRALYFVQDSDSYRIHDERQGELILNANFGPDYSSPVEGGKLAYFVQSRSYGIMNDEIKKEVRHVIEERLRVHKGIPLTPWKSVESSDVCIYHPDFTYADSSYYKGKYIQVDNANNSVTLASGNLPDMELAKPDCPICGGDFDDCGCLDSGLCCCNCDTRVHEDNSYSDDNGDVYCEECFYEFYNYCERCSEAYSRDYGEAVNTAHGTEYWCDGCASDFATRCDECGELFDDDLGNMIELGGYHSEIICEECYSNVGFHCERCEEPFHNRDVEEHHGAYYCSDCLAEVEAEEAEEAEEDEVETESEADELPVSGEVTAKTTPTAEEPTGYIHASNS